MYLKENINGIIGTIIFHLLALIVFLVFKLDKVKDKHIDQMVIEFSKEEYNNILWLFDCFNVEIKTVRTL